MKLYKAKGYKNRQGQTTTNDVIVLNDEERNYLAVRLVKLLEKINNENIQINYHDQDIILFLFNTLHFHHKGQMLDILKPQLIKIDKLILKVYGMKFLIWFEELEYEGDIVHKQDMFNIMEDRRKRKAKLSKDETINAQSKSLKRQLAKEVLCF